MEYLPQAIIVYPNWCVCVCACVRACVCVWMFIMELDHDSKFSKCCTYV